MICIFLIIPLNIYLVLNLAEDSFKTANLISFQQFMHSVKQQAFLLHVRWLRVTLKKGN